MRDKHQKNIYQKLSRKLFCQPVLKTKMDFFFGEIETIDTRGRIYNRLWNGRIEHLVFPLLAPGEIYSSEYPVDKFRQDSSRRVNFIFYFSP